MISSSEQLVSNPSLRPAAGRVGSFFGPSECEGRKGPKVWLRSQYRRSDCVRDPTVFAIRLCSRSDCVRDPTVFAIPLCRRSHCVRDPTVSAIPLCPRPQCAGDLWLSN